MSTRRSDCGLAIANFRGQKSIFICGGFDGFNCLDSAEVLRFQAADNNSSGQVPGWIQLPRMTSRRSGVKCCSLGSFVYAIGGYDGITRLNTVERFNMAQNRWEEVTPMITARSNFAVATFNGRIYVLGGFEGQKTVSDCECFDPSTNKWMRICNMILDRSALSCCVFDFSNVLLPSSMAHDRKKRLQKYVYPRSTLKITFECRMD